MFHFLSVLVAVLAFLSPLPGIGKVLDFHFKGRSQNSTLDGLETAYLHSTYGTLFQLYAKQLESFMRKSWIYAIFLIAACTFSVFVWAELYLFGGISFTSYLAKNYLKLLPMLSLLGILDYFLTYLIVRQAIHGKTKVALLLAATVAYTSLVLSESILATFFLSMKEVSPSFYFHFFFNRLWNVSTNMIGGAWTVGSVASGRKISALVYALPAAVVSSFFLISAATLAALSTKFARPIVQYFADRVLRPDEKNIHYKLSVVLMIALSLVIGSVICIVTIS